MLDPGMDGDILLPRLEESLEVGVEIIQIWNNWPVTHRQKEKEAFINEVMKIAGSYDTAVLINEEWELLMSTDLDGIHLDSVPHDYQKRKEHVGREFLAGVTCGNDLGEIQKADEFDFDYISFCAMFPSGSVESCEIVRPETVRRARKMTSIPIFVSGGITVQNLKKLDQVEFDGVAVISGILHASSPEKAVRDYKIILNNRKKSL